jgi:hypothetical protein
MSSRCAMANSKRRPERLDRHAIDGDQPPFEAVEVEPEIGRRRGVDQPQAHPAAALDAEDLRVVERPVVGEEGVVVDVVQMHGRHHGGPVVHGAGHGSIAPPCPGITGSHHAVGNSGHRPLRGPYPMSAALEAGEDLVGIAEGEVVEQHHDVLHIGAGLGRVADDQRARPSGAAPAGRDGNASSWCRAASAGSRSRSCRRGRAAAATGSARRPAARAASGRASGSGSPRRDRFSRRTRKRCPASATRPWLPSGCVSPKTVAGRPFTSMTRVPIRIVAGGAAKAALPGTNRPGANPIRPAAAVDARNWRRHKFCMTKALQNVSGPGPPGPDTSTTGAANGTPVSNVPEQSRRAQVWRGSMAELRGRSFNRSWSDNQREQSHRRRQRHTQRAGAHDHASRIMCRYVALCRDARFTAGEFCSQWQVAGRVSRQGPVISTSKMNNRRGCKDKHQQHHEPASGPRHLAKPTCWAPAVATSVHRNEFSLSQLPRDH